MSRKKRLNFFDVSDNCGNNFFRKRSSFKTKRFGNNSLTIQKKSTPRSSFIKKSRSKPINILNKNGIFVYTGIDNSRKIGFNQLLDNNTHSNTLDRLSMKTEKIFDCF